MSQKRICSLNWEEEEETHLFRSVLKELAQVIENKPLDTNTNKMKTKAWDEVYKKLNELNSRDREPSQLKIKRKTIKDHDEFVNNMLSHTKMLKDEEHMRRMEMAEEEHSIKMAIHREKLKCAILEREILEFNLQCQCQSINA